MVSFPQKTYRIMGFEKAIEHGKTKRKPYRRGKAVDKSCRNHGGCPWCEGNRLHNDRVRRQRIKDIMEEEEEYDQLLRK